MSNLRAIQSCTHSRLYPEFKIKDLETTKFVFIKFPNQQANGPFEVLEKHLHHFVVRKEDNSTDTINRANLYPAYVNTMESPRQTRASSTLFDDLFI